MRNRDKALIAGMVFRLRVIGRLLAADQPGETPILPGDLSRTHIHQPSTCKMWSFAQSSLCLGHVMLSFQL
jgi:hypothetical protein